MMRNLILGLAMIAGTSAPAFAQTAADTAPGLNDRGLPPGWHGAHIHGVGDCSDFAAGFQAAGAHAGRHDDVQHGLLNPSGPEAGDLPNLAAPIAGPFGAEFFSTRLTLSKKRCQSWVATTVRKRRQYHAWRRGVVVDNRK